jgi:hypothetical protein
MRERVPRDGLAGLPQSRVLHDHHGLLAAEISPGTNSRQIELVAGKHVADLILLAQKPMRAAHVRIGNRCHQRYSRFVESLEQEPCVLGRLLNRLIHISSLLRSLAAALHFHRAAA